MRTMKTVVLALLVVLVGGCSDGQLGQSDARGDATGDMTVADGLEGGVLPDMIPDFVPPPDSDPNQRSCYTGPVSTAGKGICRAGVQHKNTATGQWGPCQGQVLSTGFEICGDGLDTNCDGDKNNGCQTLIFFGGKVNGDTVVDDSGQGNHGTKEGGVSSKKGGIKGGSYFSYSGQGRIDFPIKLSPPFTISFWIRTQKKPIYLFWAWNGKTTPGAPSYYPRFVVLLNGSGNVIPSIDGASSFSCYFGSSYLSKSADGKWHLITVVVKSLSERSWYYDGVKVGSNTSSSCFGYGTSWADFKTAVLGDYYIGPTEAYYIGDLAYFQIDGRAWTPPEVEGYFKFMKP